MAWYSTGTVSVTASNNAVVGSGTNFIANARVGDAFRGPDGRWYEVTNIASATAISISPNYQGSTASGQAYSIAPMQGYVKASADALRQLTDSYGATIAAIQPWATASTESLAMDELGFGATGKLIVVATTAAEAQTAIDIVKTTSPTDTTAGRVWRTNDLVKTTSTADTTAGRMLKVGDGALLGSTIVNNNWDTIAATASYSNDTSAAVGIPSVTSGLICEHVQISSTSAVQYAFRIGSSQAWFRRKVSSVWSSWDELWHSGNLVKVTSALDTVGGRVLTQGYMGLGSTSVSVTDLTATDVNMARIFRMTSGATGGSGQSGGVISLPFDGTPQITYLQATNAGQVWVGVKTGATATPSWNRQLNANDKVSSLIDITADKVLITGSGGFLGSVAASLGNLINDWDDFTATAFKGGSTGAPESMYGVSVRRDASNGWQVSGRNGALRHRSRESGVNGSWLRVWDTGNTSANVQTMLAAANNAAIRTAIDSSVFPVYTFATMPAAAANTNKGIIVSDLTGGREPCFSDGTNWRRASDRTIAS